MHHTIFELALSLHECCGNSWALELPPSIKAHSVFHVRTLKPYNEPDDHRQPARPPSIQIQEGEEEYEVEQTGLKKMTRMNELNMLSSYGLHEAT